MEVDSLAGWGTRMRARFPTLGAGGARDRGCGCWSRPARPHAARRGGPAACPAGEPAMEVAGEAATGRRTRWTACRDAAAGRGAGRPGPARRRRADVRRAAWPTSCSARCPASPWCGLCERRRRGAGRQRDAGRAHGAASTAAPTAPSSPAPWSRPARGQAVLSGPVLATLHRGLREDGHEQPLTEREREVRGLMEQGLPDKADRRAADDLGEDGGEARRRGAAQDRRPQPDRARRPRRAR